MQIETDRVNELVKYPERILNHEELAAYLQTALAEHSVLNRNYCDGPAAALNYLSRSNSTTDELRNLRELALDVAAHWNYESLMSINAARLASTLHCHMKPSHTVDLAVGSGVDRTHL